MIASNYRKHPEALALQLPLPFGRALVWALPRPTTRILRQIRAARAAVFKAVGRIVHQVKATTPQWVIDARRLARAFQMQLRDALRELDFQSL